EADPGQLERSTRVNATRDRWAIKVLGVLYNVAVTHMEDAGDVHANRTLLRPIIDDDVGSTRLIVVRAHDDLDPCGGVTCIRPRIDEPGLHRPAIERGDVVAIVLPRHGRGVAKERVVAPPLAADRSKGPHHAAGRKVVECVPRHRSRGPSAHPPEPADAI